MKNIIDLNLKYPLNFIKYAYGDDHPFDFTAEDINIDEFESDIDNRLAGNVFSDRDIDVVHMRFKEHMTYKEIGERISRTDGRVGQIINLLARRLRSKVNSDYLSMRLNKDKYVRLCSKLMYNKLICNVYDMSEVVKIVNHLSGGDNDFDMDVVYNRLTSTGGFRYLDMIQFGILNYIDNEDFVYAIYLETFEEYINGSLNNLNISGRAYHEINRNGYSTIRELLCGMNVHSPEELTSGYGSIDTGIYIELVHSLIENKIPIPYQHETWLKKKISGASRMIPVFFSRYTRWISDSEIYIPDMKPGTVVVGCRCPSVSGKFKRLVVIEKRGKVPDKLGNNCIVSANTAAYFGLDFNGDTLLILEENNN